MPSPAVSTSSSKCVSTETSKSLKRTRLAGRCSPELSSSSTTIRRAKWTSESAPKSRTEPLATPSPIVASRALRSSTAPGTTGATIVSADWYGIGGAACRSLVELEREVEDLVPLPEDEPQVEMGRDLADLVPNPLRDERGVRVVEDDRLLAVEPARLLVDLRANRFQTERADLVLQLAFLPIEDLALPRHEVGDLRRRAGDGVIFRPDQNLSVGFAVGNLARRAAAEELIELGPRHAD